jgi:hypothetical protein
MYVNPIEILSLSNATEVSSIDNEIVKKAKRKLFADIDLSDNGVFEYYGLQLTKGNCEKAIDELTNNDYKEFYLYLANNKPLNEFLACGKEGIFKNFKQDSIFKLPEFVNFISTYFAPKFDKALLAAFENDNTELTKAILNTSSLIAQVDLNSAFKSVSHNIQNKIAEIDEITKDIKNEESSYNEDNLEEVFQLVKDHFPTNTLNCLPQYFQSQILKIANSINNLYNSIWDAFDSTQVPYDLSEYLLNLNIGGLNRPTFENNFRIIKKKNDERIEQAENAPFLKKWAIVLINLKNIASEIEKDKIKPKGAYVSISAVSIEELNKLPSFANEIRTSIALVLRSISISMWNIHRDIDTAIKTITKAANINLSDMDIARLNTDLEKLNEIKKENYERGEPIKSTPDISPINGIGTFIYGKTLYFVFFYIPILPLTRYNCEAINNGYRFYGKLKLHLWQKIWKWGLIGGLSLWIIIALADSNKSSSNEYPASEPATTNDNLNAPDNSTPTTTDEYTSPVESQYIGNQLENGASPLTDCFGNGLYSGNATLTIENGGNSDAIICLYSISDDRTIRNEYVQKNSSFKMSKISQGEYKIRIFYGNNWNPELENNCGTKGNFESDINFSEFDGTEYFEDSERGYTNATVTLYTVAGGNATSSAIDQSQFFKK